MSRKNRFKDAKDKREPGGFVSLPYVVIRSVAFARLTPYAVKLLADLLAQYKGHNNGDLCATGSVMQKRGWRSNATLRKARDELLRLDWIEIARQGGRHRPTLYAVTFIAVDDCKGKLDIGATHSPRGAWRRHEPAPVILLVQNKNLGRHAA